MTLERAAPREPEPLLASVREGRLFALGAAWVQRRPLYVGPVALCLGILLALSGHPRSRTILALIALGAIVVHTGIDALRARRKAFTQAELAISIGFVLLDYAICAGATGGIRSPFVPMLVGMPIASTVAFGSSAVWKGLLGLFVWLVFVLTILPAELAGPTIPGPWDDAMLGLAFAYVVLVSARNLHGISDAYVGAAERAAVLRESVLAQQQERVRSLEAMGTKVAHELKNPLAAIHGLVQLLERGTNDAKSSERLAVVASEVERMRDILADYLRFARPLTALRVGDVDLGALADEVLAVLEARAESAGVTLARNGEVPTLRADRRKLEEALLNVVGNAIEATPSGGRVTIALHVSAEGAVLEVRDTGKGMPADVLARVGTPYFTTREEGTGLGVVLARGVAEQHGGSLRYASVPGQGTTATLTLPIHAEGSEHG